MTTLLDVAGFMLATARHDTPPPVPLWVRAFFATEHITVVATYDGSNPDYGREPQTWRCTVGFITAPVATTLALDQPLMLVPAGSTVAVTLVEGDCNGIDFGVYAIISAHGRAGTMNICCCLRTLQCRKQ